MLGQRAKKRAAQIARHINSCGSDIESNVDLVQGLFTSNVSIPKHTSFCGNRPLSIPSYIQYLIDVRCSDVLDHLKWVIQKVTIQ